MTKCKKGETLTKEHLEKARDSLQSDNPEHYVIVIPPQFLADVRISGYFTEGELAQFLMGSEVKGLILGV